MLDHTYCGKPVRKMSVRDIQTCLRVGFEVLDDCGMTDASYWIRLRLEVELVIRSIESEST